MNDVPQQAGEFLESVFNSTGLGLGVTVRAGLTGPVLDIDGEDAELLQAQTGELLEALQHLVNQIFGRGLEGGERLVCDVRGFRATREAELKAMANLAASRVRQTGCEDAVLRRGATRSPGAPAASYAPRHRASSSYSRRSRLGRGRDTGPP